MLPVPSGTVSPYELVVVVGAAVLGVAAAGMAWTRLGDAVRVAMASTPTSGTAAGAVVRVEGAVRLPRGDSESDAGTGVPDEGTVTAPVSGRECVGYVVSQHQRFATRIPIPRWRSVHAAGTVEAFALETPEGRTSGAVDDGVVRRVGGAP